MLNQSLVSIQISWNLRNILCHLPGSEFVCILTRNLLYIQCKLRYMLCNQLAISPSLNHWLKFCLHSQFVSSLGQINVIRIALSIRKHFVGPGTVGIWKRVAIKFLKWHLSINHNRLKGIKFLFFIHIVEGKLVKAILLHFKFIRNLIPWFVPLDGIEFLVLCIVRVNRRGSLGFIDDFCRVLFCVINGVNSKECTLRNNISWVRCQILFIAWNRIHWCLSQKCSQHQSIIGHVGKSNYVFAFFQSHIQRMYG